MADAYTVQVLEKNDYTSQHLVSIPADLPSLPAQSIRVKSSLISLTRNNLTYAKLGHLHGWWDVHLLPTTIPAEFSNPKVYGRISAWGYGTIVESTIEELPIGAQVYGYLPIGTLPVDLRLDAVEGMKDNWFERSSHRAKRMNVYNRYTSFPAPKQPLSDAEKESKAYDALMQVLFETAFTISRYTFTWSDPAIHPFTGADFEADKADVSDAIVLIMPAGSKTALALAQQLLAGGRPAEFQPRRVIGIGSAASKTLAQKSGFYDQLLDYADVKEDLMEKLGVHVNISKAVLVDCGAREGTGEQWTAALKKQFETVLPVAIASSISSNHTPAEVTAKYTDAVRVNMSVLRDKAIERDGEKAYRDAFLEEWSDFKENGGIRGLKMEWGKSMDELGEAWNRLCKGEIGPDIGLVFEL